MKWILALFLIAAVAGAATFIPPKTAARMTARGIRATWDWLASLGPPKANPHRRVTRKVQAAAAHRTSREGIVAQPPKEHLGQADRTALDSLVRHKK